METFSIMPAYQWQATIGRRVLISNFESGIEQRRDKGPMPREWVLGFAGKEKISQLTDFYNARKGPVETFLWVPPEAETPVTVRFKDDSVQSAHYGLQHATVEIVLREVL